MAEIQHNTDEQVRDYLTKALALTEELDPPEDLRQLCFAKAADLYTSKTIMAQQPPAIAMGGLGLPPGNSSRRG